MKNITFQRNQLYKKVWSKPVSHLAKDFGIASHQLYKVCEKLKIPTPSSGYWAKLRHNKKIKKPKLPESEKETFTLTLRKKPKSSEKSTKAKKTITVSKRLTKPHPLIKQARKNIDKKFLNRYNRIRGGAPLDLSVAPNNVERSLRILDILFKEIENRKYGLRTYRKNNSHWMLIEDGKDEVYFQLREKGDRTDVSDEDTSWSEYEYTPTGELQFVLFRETYDRSGRVLSDTQTQKLEDRLDEFFFKLESMAEKLKMERLKREKRLQKRELERQIEKAIKQQEKDEDERLDILEQRATTFTKSQYIYDFIAENRETTIPIRFN